MGPPEAAHLSHPLNTAADSIFRTTPTCGTSYSRATRGQPSTTRGTASPIVMDGQALIRLLQNQKESLLAWLMLKTPSARPAMQDHPIHLPVLHLADAQRQPRRFAPPGQVPTTACDNFENRRQGSRLTQCHLATPLLVPLTFCRYPSGLRRTIAVEVSSERTKIAQIQSLLLAPRAQVRTMKVAYVLPHVVGLSGV